MAEPRKRSTTGIMRRLSARVHRPDPNKMSLRAEHVVLDSDDEEAPPPPVPLPLPVADHIPATPAAAPSAAASSPWGLARPLSTTASEIGADEAEQLRILDKGRALVRQIMERLPQVEEKGNAHESKGGVVVHREHGGHLSVSILPHPDSLGVARWDLYMVDNWHVDLVLRGNSLATGLLPLLAMFREPDLVADYLPRQAGLPYIESLQFEKVFADNDWLYHCFVTPFGPLPGADDVHGLTAFDLLDEPEGGLMMYAESPAEGVAVHRGWDVPKVNHWRRKRNYVLGSTVFFRPSTDLRPLSTPLPPANVARAGPCRSPNCPYFASSVLSNGACTYCCAKCAERPGKHGALCQKHPIAGGAPPPEWELPLHGTVDFELFLHMKIPSEDSHNAASLTAASCCRDLAWLPTLLTTHGPHAASSRVPRLTPHFTPRLRRASRRPYRPHRSSL